MTSAARSIVLVDMALRSTGARRPAATRRDPAARASTRTSATPVVALGLVGRATAATRSTTAATTLNTRVPTFRASSAAVRPGDSFIACHSVCGTAKTRNGADPEAHAAPVAEPRGGEQHEARGEEASARVGDEVRVVRRLRRHEARVEAGEVVVPALRRQDRPEPGGRVGDAERDERDRGPRWRPVPASCACPLRDRARARRSTGARLASGQPIDGESRVASRRPTVRPRTGVAMYGRILVGVAKTESARRAVDVALDLAERYGAELHLVMACSTSGGGAGGRDPRHDAEGHLASIQKRTSVPTHIHVLPGDPADGAPDGRRRGQGRPHRRGQQGRCRAPAGSSAACRTRWPTAPRARC